MSYYASSVTVFMHAATPTCWAHAWFLLPCVAFRTVRGSALRYLHIWVSSLVFVERKVGGRKLSVLET